MLLTGCSKDGSGNDYLQFARLETYSSYSPTLPLPPSHIQPTIRWLSCSKWLTPDTPELSTMTTSIVEWDVQLQQKQLNTIQIIQVAYYVVNPSCTLNINLHHHWYAAVVLNTMCYSFHHGFCQLFLIHRVF